MRRSSPPHMHLSTHCHSQPATAATAAHAMASPPPPPPPPPQPPQHAPTTRTGAAPSSSSSVRFLLLGAAQDAGLPQCGCACANCAAAWEGRAPRQHAVSGALIDDAAGSAWLLDCSPDFREQYRLLQQHLAASQQQDEPQQLRGVLLTHLHYGHYAGLLQFGKEVMDWRGLKVWGTQAVLDFLKSNQPWATAVSAGNLALQQPPLVPGSTLQLSERVAVTPLAVPHRAEFSDTVGFHVQGPSRRLLYLPDIDSWAAWLAAGTDVREVVRSVDVALLDACFNDASELPGRDMRLVPHPLVTDTLARLQGVADGHHRVVLVHMNHTNPLWRRGPERAAVEAAGLEVGEAGAVYAL